MKYRLSARDDVVSAVYHRKPTGWELRFGYGAIHYRTFPIDKCCRAGTRILKRWFVADDGLRYYR